jgi:hypothetical protein
MLGMLKAKVFSPLKESVKRLLEKLDPLAKKSGLVVRKSKGFSASGFVLSLMKSIITGKASYNQLAVNLGHSELKSISRQAIWKRMDLCTIPFLLDTVGTALKQRWSEEALIATGVFGRVIIEDSSQVKLPKANHEEFPGHGNDGGKTAGCKFDMAFDLLTGEPVTSVLHLATEQDREIGKDLVDLIREKDLVLRDMGYFSRDEFARIENCKAYWISRAPINVKIHDLSKNKLETILKKTKRNKLELEVILGGSGHPARLIAERAAPEVAEKRRRERREQARQLGKEPSKDMLIRDGWYLLVTNVKNDLMTAAKLFKLYAIRWQIEITFRAWKQSGKLVSALARKSNPVHLQALMLASMLLLILTMKISSLLQETYRRVHISIEKIADNLASYILGITSIWNLADYDPDPRHVKFDRRSRLSLREIAISCLS